MNARDILAQLRAGAPPSPGALAWFAQALASGEVDDAQAGAFAMGMCHTALPASARAELTLAMRDTGDVLRWDLPGPVVDKHSTGGVGDPLSLILGPALAATGAYAPLLSGRGLGHTGGTLDKFEAIPGVSTELSRDRFQAVTRDCGWALAAASADVAPADRRLYAIRDVTSTVPSIDLITASILSKKLAGGAEALVLDVKCGSGAFMQSEADARALAEALVSTAQAAGAQCAALISDMNQPCVPAVGNALEIAEVLRVLTGAATGDALTLSAALCDSLGHKTGQAIASGAAAEQLQRVVAAQGGPSDLLDHWQRHLPKAPCTAPLPAPKAGWLTAIDGQALGMAVVDLGGGRRRAGDPIDASVGLSEVLRLGTQVTAGDPLALVHAADADTAERIAARLTQAFTIADAPAPPPDLIKAHIT